jgi:YgiT-type zinc finger domain-containing protein
MGGTATNDQLLLRWIVTCIESGRYSFTTRALTKHPPTERFTARQALTTLKQGTIIARRDDANRCVVCGEAAGIPTDPTYIGGYIHCVVQWDEVAQVENPIQATLSIGRRGEAMSIGATEDRAPTVCASCGGTMRPSLTELVFARGEIQVVVQDVPSTTCEACGEQLVPGAFGLVLSDEVEAILTDLEALADQERVLARPRSLVMQATTQPELAVAV